MRYAWLLATLLAGSALAQESQEPSEDVTESTAADPAPATETGADAIKPTLGMSILGNEEAPKALVIVPWKSSRIGDGLGVNDSLDDRAAPVDREVFMREVRFYELRSGTAED